MELNWLRYFYEVAQVKSVTIASQRLRVSQPAVTKMIKQLEAHFEYPLLKRKGRGIDLTPEGRKLYEHCIPIFKKLNQLGSLQGGNSLDQAEVMKIGASDSLCNYVFPKAVARFAKVYPKVDWNLYSGTSSEIKQKLISGEIDYGVFYTRIGMQDRQLLEERVLTKLSFSVVCAKSLSRFRTIAQLNQAGLPYVGSRMSDYPTTIPEQWIHGKLGIKIGKTFQSNNKEAQKNLILEGMGFGVLPTFMTFDLKSKLTCFESKETQINLLLVTRKGESATPLFEKLLNDYLLKEFKQTIE